MTNSKENLPRPGIIDARARYLAATRRLRNTAVEDTQTFLCLHFSHSAVRIVRQHKDRFHIVTSVDLSIVNMKVSFFSEILAFIELYFLSLYKAKDHHRVKPNTHAQ